MKKEFLLTLSFIIGCCIVYGQVNTSSVIVENALDQMASVSGSRIYNGTGIPQFSSKDATKGSRYLFNDWVKGTVVMTNGDHVNASDLLYNYDKINKSLLVTADRKIVLDLNKENVASFTLHGADEEYKFKKVPVINEQDFFQPLVEDTAKYSLYKFIDTKFIKADYRSDGLVETGNNYDEFADASVYYIIMPGGKAFQKIEGLKSKTIKVVLANEKAKVDAYFSNHKQDIINEYFLIDLITALNQ